MLYILVSDCGQITVFGIREQRRQKLQGFVHNKEEMGDLENIICQGTDLKRPVDRNTCG